VEGSLEFRGVSARYRPHLPLVLDCISFRIEPGEHVGIIGRTGCGKSTLANCIFRLLEVETGSIHVGGVDIATLPLQCLRQRLSVIPQEPLLWQGTIAHNLDPFDEFTEQQLWEALRQCCLDVVVELWPARLQTAVDEAGTALSVGQRQLLTIARTLLKSSKIVVLDEATANMDSKTDATIQGMLRSSDAFKKSTMLIIAHRLETLEHCNRVLQLQHGTPTQVTEVARPGLMSSLPRNCLAELSGLPSGLVASRRCVC